MAGRASVPTAQTSSSSSDVETQQEADGVSEFTVTRKEVLGVCLLVTAFGLVLGALYFTMPSLDYSVLKIPRSIPELQTMKEYLSSYAQDYPVQMVLGYTAIYVLMQTFMIPGTICLSLLGGALFGFVPALFMVVGAATAGASACYFLSLQIGGPIVYRLWPDRLTYLRNEVRKRKSKLLNYMLFLRLTPTLPNTFVNFSSPIVGIPFPTFLLATMIGLIPGSIVSVRAGLTLGELASFNDLCKPTTLFTFLLIGLLAIIRTFLSGKDDTQTEPDVKNRIS